MTARRIGILTAVVLCLAGPSGRAKEGVVRCANLIYGGTHTSRCFSDQFLSAVQKDTAIPTARRFKSVKLASDELFTFPFVVMTGESDFRFTGKERKNLKRYLEEGGFLLASAGCSSKAWDRSFRRELRRVFKDGPSLASLAMEHPVFHTVYDIDALKLHHAAPGARLEGLTFGDRLAVVYSSHGLNDTAHTEGCCCCGGNEISNSLQVNANVFVYALTH